jgi:hypothetical protein
MRARIAVVAALSALSGLALVPPAHAAGAACVDATLIVNGDTVVDEHHCVDLP